MTASKPCYACLELCRVPGAHRYSMSFYSWEDSDWQNNKCKSQRGLKRGVLQRCTEKLVGGQIQQWLPCSVEHTAQTVNQMPAVGQGESVAAGRPMRIWGATVGSGEVYTHPNPSLDTTGRG